MLSEGVIHPANGYRMLSGMESVRTCSWILTRLHTQKAKLHTHIGEMLAISYAGLTFFSPWMVHVPAPRSLATQCIALKHCIPPHNYGWEKGSTPQVCYIKDQGQMHCNCNTLEATQCKEPLKQNTLLSENGGLSGQISLCLPGQCLKAVS